MNLYEIIEKEKEGFKPSDMMKFITALGIASKKFVRKDIDKIFNENKILYINEYKNSILYNMNFLKGLSYNTEVYTIRVIGIIEHSLKIKDYTNIVNLYRLAFKRIYNNLKNKKLNLS